MTEEEANDIELIERFHKGILSAIELQSLKDRMTADPSFAQRVDDFKDIFIGIKAHGDDKFSKEVQSWEREIRSESKLSFNWKIAAVLLVLITAGTIYIFKPRQEGPEKLFTAYFKPYEDIISARGGQSPMDAYNKRNYPEAVRQLKEYLSNASGDLNARFYYGISLIASGEETQGIESLDQVIAGNGILKEQAEWYRALGSLKLGLIAEATRQLESINRPGHDYQPKAKELLDKL